MPTPPLHVAFAKLYCILPGAPWNLETWRARTKCGILNPEKDEDLPTGLDREKANQILAYLDAYKAIPTEDTRQAFARGEGVDHPGRLVLGDFIRKRWSRWGIQNAVVEDLRTLKLLPLQDMVLNDTTELTDGAATLVTAWANVGLSLFGEDVINDAGRLNPKYNSPVQIIVQHVYKNLKTQAKKTINRIKHSEEEVTKLVDGMPFLTISAISNPSVF
jgi:hypothetical protein